MQPLHIREAEGELAFEPACRADVLHDCGPALHGLPDIGFEIQSVAARTGTGNDEYAGDPFYVFLHDVKLAEAELGPFFQKPDVEPACLPASLLGEGPAGCRLECVRRMVCIGQLDAGPDHHVIVQEMPTERVLGKELGHAHVAQFVDTIRIVHHAAEVADLLLFAVQRKDGLVDRGDPFLVDRVRQDPFREPGRVFLFSDIVFVIASVCELSDVVQQACEQGRLRIPPLCFRDVVGNATDPGAVGPETGEFLIRGIALIGRLLFDQRLSNLLEHTGREGLKRVRAGCPHSGLGGFHVFRPASFFPLLGPAPIVPVRVDVREGPVDPFRPPVSREPVFIQATGLAALCQHLDFEEVGVQVLPDGRKAPLAVQGVQELRHPHRIGDHDVERTEFEELGPDDLFVQERHVRRAHKGHFILYSSEAAADAHQGAVAGTLIDHMGQAEEFVLLRRVRHEKDFLEQGTDHFCRPFDDRPPVDLE
jgi:hypothetical protein